MSREFFGNPLTPPRPRSISDRKNLAFQLLGEGGKEIARRMELVKKRGVTHTFANSFLSIETNDSESKEEERVRVIERLYEDERQSLLRFFGERIDVDRLPEEITVERIERWKELGFALHFLPDTNLFDDQGVLLDFPGWKIPPDNYLFFECAQHCQMDASSLVTQRGWRLIDEYSLSKMKIVNGVQDYQSDPLGSVLQTLNERDVIDQRTFNGGVLARDSRFGLSNGDIMNEQVRKACAEVIGVPSKDLVLPYAVEYILFTNLYYPYWASDALAEHLADRYGEHSHCTAGPHPSHLLEFRLNEVRNRFNDHYLGFRYLARFPSK